MLGRWGSGLQRFGRSSGLCGEVGRNRGRGAGDFAEILRRQFRVKRRYEPAAWPRSAAKFSPRKGADSARAAERGWRIRGGCGEGDRELIAIFPAGTAGGLRFFYAFFNADCQSGIKYLFGPIRFFRSRRTIRLYHYSEGKSTDKPAGKSDLGSNQASGRKECHTGLRR